MANDHAFCYACALENQSFITNFTRHASHYTIQLTHSRTHTHVSMILYFIIPHMWCSCSNLTLHINGMTYSVSKLMY